MHFVRPYVRGEKLTISTPTELVRCVVEDGILVARPNSNNARNILVKFHGFKMIDDEKEAVVAPVVVPEPEPAPVKKPTKRKAAAAVVAPSEE
jgi:hypothetical protein